ncbi:MAG: hypothetical protein ACE5OP_00390 [Candidatus Glassbacteria bacterium]
MTTQFSLLNSYHSPSRTAFKGRAHRLNFPYRTHRSIRGGRSEEVYTDFFYYSSGVYEFT